MTTRDLSTCNMIITTTGVQLRALYAHVTRSARPGDACRDVTPLGPAGPLFVLVFEVITPPLATDFAQHL
jgi:hypothetical protein